MADTDKKKILVVEDDFFIRDLYEKQLQLSGFLVVGASDGEQGVEKTKQEKPDLVLLDIMLPKMNGLDVLKNIKSNPEIKETRIILLTNLGQESVIKEGFALGAEGYLVKSAYTPSQVVEEVKNLLGQK
ncbi:MAG TPA: response regulator [Patescibacteria group bacterium]|nr:response regulator [Patescibacteria group bacterium]